LSNRQSGYIKPLPVMVYFVIVLILCMAGLAVSLYLSFSHYRVYTDIGYRSFCAISRAVNCDTVSQSPYSIFLGVPVPIWGIIGYVFMLVTIVFSLNTRGKKIRLLATLIFMALIFSLVSLCLGIISAVKIHSYCIMCIATYAINFMLLYMFWLTRRRFENNGFIESFKLDSNFWKSIKTKALCFYLTLIALSLVTALSIPPYWKLKPPHTNIVLHTGFTNKGFPWIGAEKPELTITEFTDYFCFQCKKMHFYLRALVSQYPDKLRLVHRQFPMDHKFNPMIKETFHPGSGIMALIAIYAETQHKFWETNDVLYNYDISKHAIYLRKIAKAAHLDVHKLARAVHDLLLIHKLEKDIFFGIKHHITGTPGYIIDGKTYIGDIPPEILNSLSK